MSDEPHLPSLLDSEDAVARLAGEGPSLVALDFDGTLTEIVDDPAAPRLTAERRRILARLPGPSRTLAVVSGRGLADVRARVGLEEAIYVGNHGLQIEGPGIAERHPEAEAIAARLDRLLDALPDDPAVSVEHKGLTATLHVRPRDDAALHRRVGERIRGAVQAAGFLLRPGKASWEVRPDAEAHKGRALRLLLERVGVPEERALYVGDDVTDEDAFRALPRGVTARVGAEGVDTAAGHRLADPDEVYAFLARLVEA